MIKKNFLEKLKKTVIKILEDIELEVWRIPSLKDYRNPYKMLADKKKEGQMH